MHLQIDDKFFTRVFKGALAAAVCMALFLAPGAGAADRSNAAAINGAGTVTAGGLGPIVQPRYGPKATTVDRAARHYRVSFWIMWGIAGAESGWGTGGSNLFGLLAGAEGADTSSWRQSSLQASKLMRRLHDQLGSWQAAMLQYSGTNYGLDHVRYMFSQQSPDI